MQGVIDDKSLTTASENCATFLNMAEEMIKQRMAQKLKVLSPPRSPVNAALAAPVLMNAARAQEKSSTQGSNSSPKERRKKKNKEKSREKRHARNPSSPDRPKSISRSNSASASKTSSEPPPAATLSQLSSSSPSTALETLPIPISHVSRSFSTILDPSFRETFLFLIICIIGFLSLSLFYAFSRIYSLETQIQYNGHQNEKVDFIAHFPS